MLELGLYEPSVEGLNDAVCRDETETPSDPRSDLLGGFCPPVHYKIYRVWNFAICAPKRIHVVFTQPFLHSLVANKRRIADYELRLRPLRGLWIDVAIDLNLRCLVGDIL